MSWGSKHGDDCSTDYLPVAGRAVRIVRWSALPERAVATFVAVDARDTLRAYCLTERRLGTLWCLGPDGVPRWHSTAPAALMSSPALDPESGRCALADGEAVWMFGPDGDLHWRTSAPGPAVSVQFLVEDVLLVLAADFSLRRFCARSGAPLGDPVRLPVSTASAVADSGRGRRGLRLLAAGLRRIGVPAAVAPLVVARFLGRRRETKHIPAIDPRTGCCYVGCMDADAGALFCIAPAERGGEVVFRHGLPAHCDCSPVLDPVRRRVYAFDRSGQLHAVDMDDGRPLWRASLDGDHVHSPCMADGTLYFGFRDRILAVADRGDRAETLWSRPLRDLDGDARRWMINSSLCLDRHHVYGVAHRHGLPGRWWPSEHALLAFDRASGALVGKTALPHESFGTLSMLSDGTLLMPSKPVLLGLRRLIGLGRRRYQGLHALA